jgi:hypothetical protein
LAMVIAISLLYEKGGWFSRRWRYEKASEINY